MINRRLLGVYAACLSVSVSGVLLSTGAHAAPMPGVDEVGATYKTLMENVGPALVTVKFILKVEAGGQMAEMFGRMADEGIETEVTGVMIEKSGLVLVSNTQLGGYIGMMASRFGGSVTPNPTDLKILVGDDTEGLKAKFLARDKDLDLAWVQIDDPKSAGKEFKSVEISSGATVPAVGTQLYTVSRRGKFFDHALVVGEGRVGGVAKKPRSLIIPSGEGGMSGLGMPVFDGAGNVIGVEILQMPNRDDMEGGDMSDMMSGGVAVMILPAADVAKATARGKTLGASSTSGNADKPKGDTPPAESGASDK